MARINWINEPTWPANRDYIYFGTPSSVIDPALYRVRVRDHKLERLASLRPTAEGEVWTGVMPVGSL
jgi:hypothetical protein